MGKRSQRGLLIVFRRSLELGVYNADSGDHLVMLVLVIIS